MTDSRRGLILINTGPGKGKTTAALGTALRAVGNGMRVLVLQFLKGSWHYGELDAVEAFGGKFVLKQMGRGFVKVGGAETDPEDIRLVEAAWAEARKTYRKQGPFLFGRFSAADAMFAPVVNRLHVYDVPVKKESRDYMDAIMALAAWKAWIKDAEAEPWRIERYDSI